jgi:hypothetical protein
VGQTRKLGDFGREVAGIVRPDRTIGYSGFGDFGFRLLSRFVFVTRLG